MTDLSVPLDTYRLQFNAGFTFRDAAATVPYLAELGVTHAYSSPYLMASPGSTHGYDICDHRQLNPEVGTQADYDLFTSELRAHGMGQVLDFVPNHMGIDPRTNPWWHDVLENGRSSAFARYFDIDWDPVKPELKGKVLLPILGDQYGLVLERGELRLGFEDGGLYLDYFDNRLPVNPRQAVRVYEQDVGVLTASLGEEHADLREFLSIMTSLRNLPAIQETDPGRIAERRREKEVARERLVRLTNTSPQILEHIEAAVAAFNGTPGEPESFDRLHALLEVQAYRLSDWRSAAHEINYRRFFDINSLAALRMEDREVFDATHELVRELLVSGKVNGLRIDHPDGLYDPVGYFERLKELPDSRARLYVLAEKILSEDEPLPEDWMVDGTTGYGFANDVTGLLVDPSGARALRQLFARFTGVSAPFREIVYQAKKLITRTSLASELNVLAHALNKISESNRRSRDFTLESLRTVLQEVVACFPVYRTYISHRGWTAADRDRIEAAVAGARGRNPAIASSQFDFFREVVLPRRNAVEPGGGERRDGYAPAGVGDYDARLVFSMKLQQYTAPVQAKGVEDTAFYRYNLLVALNEVGGDPSQFGRPPEEVHARNAERRARWPHAMLATATHDTKLGEDVRARIAVISELPGEWRRHVSRWARLNARYRRNVQGSAAPDRNDEYRFYQVLLGMWPAVAAEGEDGPRPSAGIVDRVRDYMMKATKEAKVHTSWINDNQEYDAATAAFVELVLTGPASGRFLASFLPFQARVARLGVANSLSQVVLKLASPGVPDFYQGTELWDLHLVDPDNRRAVDYAHRHALLRQLLPLLPQLDADTTRQDERLALLADMLDGWPDARVKLWVTAAGLLLRKHRPRLFLEGDYVPLDSVGARPGQLFAFARTHHEDAVIAAVPRFVARLGENWREWAAAWGTTAVRLPPSLAGRRWFNALTGEHCATERQNGEEVLAAGVLLRNCPVALLKARAGL